ncbi:O-antigen ligase [Ereboglobus sp. PH5-5]|nr:O-antigen ligase [Ereboglobus sp. PH5-5]
MREVFSIRHFVKLSGKDLVIVLIALVVAVWAGLRIASETMTLPIMVGGILLCVIVAHVSPVRFNPLVLGLLIAGYVLGNRGFAQLSISGSLPLFPAELGIAATLTVLLWRCAREKKLPWRNDFLNWALIFWIAVSTVRLPLDARTYGAMALRDYAMVYYALFFFVAQEAFASDAGRRWARRCLLAGTAMLPLLYGAFSLWPDFFLGTLTVRGLPLIYFKGDLAGTFMSVGALVWFIVFERGKSPWRWLAVAISLGLVAAMLATENRAAMLALAAGVAVMLIGGRWRFAAALVSAGAVAVVAILFWAQTTGRPWEKTPLHGISQRVVSIVDFQGARDYSSAEGAESKGDNNRFRAIWWETVVDETVAANPWTGLGYGHDLAEGFLRAYYADSSDQFTTRSPHNLLLSIFARTGVAGLGAFMILCTAMLFRTWKVSREDSRRSRERLIDTGEWTGPQWKSGAWCCVWAIFTSACFGVVLEGPMGAVVFWILLGAAAASSNGGAPKGDEAKENAK